MTQLNVPLDVSLSQGNGSSPRAARSRFSTSRLSELPRQQQTPFPAALVPWKSAVQNSADACLLIDSEARVRALSPASRSLLGLPRDIEAVMPRFLDAGLHFVDFSSAGQRLAPAELARLPVLRALESGTLERGLARVVIDKVHRTLDMVAAPLHRPEEPEPSGAMVFFQDIDR
ncbi:hypothetical protein [Salininema proteolyticum]|uniref:PAS domain-containing protein n=1 Tax=Salininema proteolyticum TaxID=1607685 RepID=A0ABV8TTN5_9ACTN